MFLSLSKLLLPIAVGVALPVAFSAAAVDKLETEKEKASYMVGMDMARNLEQLKDEIDINIVIQALDTAFKGGESLLTEEETDKIRSEFMRKVQANRELKRKEQAETNKTEGEKFLAENKKKKGIKTTESGLQYEVLKDAKGDKPKATDRVKVHYTGTLIDGTKFDSSVDRGEPAEFPLNGVIPGWTEGLQLMPVGSKFKFYVPSELGYGERGTPGPIGPNATLIFDVELLEILK